MRKEGAAMENPGCHVSCGSRSGRGFPLGNPSNSVFHSEVWIRTLAGSGFDKHFTPVIINIYPVALLYLSFNDLKGKFVQDFILNQPL